MSQPRHTKFLRRVGWILVLILAAASSAHLLRTALRASENKAILIAALAFALCVIFKLGRRDLAAAADLPPRKRPYIPLSTIPVLLLAIWAANARLFGAFDVSAVLFHLKHSLAYDGVGDDVVEFAAYLIFALLLIACLSYLAKRDRRMAVLERIAAVALLLINPAASYAYDRLLNPDRNGLKLDQAYRAVDISATAERPKNLIVIYLESMESTYSEPVFETAFDDLNTLSAQGLRVNGMTQIQDTAWTMAGLVASQCGVPLLSYGLVMKNRMKNIETFLPNAECLATQLSGRGYQTRFYGGASLNFAGKGKFLSSHGFQNAIGLDEIEPAKRGKVGEWGIYDDRLYALALEELQALSDGGAPYFLSILTLGAHFPKGYPAPSCFNMFEDAAQMDSTLLSVACTGRLTLNFLKDAEQRGLLDNTVVVLLSDHLSQKNAQTERLNTYDRENFLLFLGSDIEPDVITKRGAMIDVYPSILESIGLPAKSGQAGLGVSLLGSEPTLLEDNGLDQLNLAIRADKDLRARLWDLAEPQDETARNP